VKFTAQPVARCRCESSSQKIALPPELVLGHGSLFGAARRRSVSHAKGQPRIAELRHFVVDSYLTVSALIPFRRYRLMRSISARGNPSNS
jgi:hypothetical protein